MALESRLTAIAARTARATAAWTYRLRARSSPARIGLVLLYHVLADAEGNPAQEINAALAGATFAGHLRHLRRCYRVVPASEIVSAASSRARGQRLPVAITFDDDLPSHASHAAPALRRERLPATFFLSGAGLRGPFSFWWQLLQRAWDRGLIDARLLESWGIRELNPSVRQIAGRLQRMSPDDRAAAAAALQAQLGPGNDVLSKEAIQALCEAGFEIGFHTLDHDDLVELDGEALQRAMRVGRAELEHVVGPLVLLSYPHGRADGGVAAAARAAGFRFAFVVNGAPVRPGDDPHLLGRRYPARGTSGQFALDVARTLVAAAR
jgi:peptidoglycan/xylan/chitin deacetylase (PgdA/CDA1 family)